jgi:hypothetical protein
MELSTSLDESITTLKFGDLTDKLDGVNVID